LITSVMTGSTASPSLRLYCSSGSQQLSDHLTREEEDKG